jgi:hypothetical protein
MREPNIEKHALSRITSFGLGVSCSALATTVVTLAYGWGNHNITAPVLFGVGASLFGVGTMLWGDTKPSRPATPRRGEGTRPDLIP